MENILNVSYVILILSLNVMICDSWLIYDDINYINKLSTIYTMSALS